MAPRTPKPKRRVSKARSMPAWLKKEKAFQPPSVRRFLKLNRRPIDVALIAHSKGFNHARIRLILLKAGVSPETMRKTMRELDDRTPGIVKKY